MSEEQTRKLYDDMQEKLWGKKKKSIKRTIKMTGITLTDFEQRVSDAVILIYMSSVLRGVEPILTAEMVCERLFWNTPDCDKETEEQRIQDVENALEKFRNTIVTVKICNRARLEGFYMPSSCMCLEKESGGKIRIYNVSFPMPLMVYQTYDEMYKDSVRDFLSRAENDF